jgi:hypothetical protein
MPKPALKVGDDAVEKATGKTWPEWFKILDKAGAKKLPHAKIATLLAEKHEVKPWWSQMVTVGYEQARGLRVLHEAADGFQASGNKTIGVPVEKLFDAFVNDAQREKWLGDVLTVRKATKPKSARFDFKGGTLIGANFYAKGPGKSSVSLDQRKLKSAKEAAQAKKFWAEKLEILKMQLEA